MESSWKRYGIHMEKVWKRYGIHVEKPWNPSTIPWNPSTKSMESIPHSMESMPPFHGIHPPFHGIHLEFLQSIPPSMDSTWNNPGRVKYWLIVPSLEFTITHLFLLNLPNLRICQPLCPLPLFISSIGTRTPSSTIISPASDKQPTASPGTAVNALSTQPDSRHPHNARQQNLKSINQENAAPSSVISNATSLQIQDKSHPNE